jgi:hypothetical protein
MAKKLTLTTPEALPDITACKLVNVNIDPSTGRANASCIKVDSGGEIRASHHVEFTLAQADIDSIATTLYTEAQEAGQLSAETIENE